MLLMLIQKSFAALVVLISAISLSACNGASEDSSSTPTGALSINLSFATANNGQCGDVTTRQSFTSVESFCAIAQLKQGGTNVSGAIIEFIADIGAATPTSKLTDANGQATAIISLNAATPNAGTLSVMYAPTGADSVSASRSYEFIQATVNLPENTSLMNGVFKNGFPVAQFKIGETVELQARLLDGSSQGVANQIVTFQAGNANLVPNTSLTDTQGIAKLSYTPTAAELGAYTLVTTTNYQGTTLSRSSNYQVVSADAVSLGTVKLGHFDSNNKFIEGKLGTSLIADQNGKYQISAGGSFGVNTSLVLEDTSGTTSRLQSPNSIIFSSDCGANSLASLDSPVTTLSGTASATFQDINCSGNSERSDSITATVQVDGSVLTASLDFTLARQTLASLSFVSATPSSIRIKGSGGTGSTESSLVTFLVTSANGQPTAQQQVDFSLDTVIGGLTFANALANQPSKASSITNANGLATVRVQAGTVPTPVRVTASATDKDTNDIITSQSEQLTVNTGLPQQLGFSIAASTFNPEAAAYNGEKVTITIYASDSFGNPAPDDTTVNFTAEGGQIEPSCLTKNGSCFVTWTSTAPRVSDHRITILAYALGHETFFDTNGNNQFDAADGGAITNACVNSNNLAIACTGNGMDIETYHNSGFSDLGDAFRDDNETGVYEAGKPYFNAQAKTAYSGPDGKFNGPQCTGSLCGTGQANKTYIRKALVLTMSGSQANFIIKQDGVVINDFNTDISPIPAAGRSHFSVQLFDRANQILPAQTTLNVEASEGDALFNGHTVPNTTRAGGTNTEFTLVNTATGTSTVTLTVTTPKGVATQLTFNVPLL
jgi:hypothetical protein